MSRFLRISAAVSLAMVIATFASLARAATYEVTIEDQIPGGPDTGQPFSPPVAVVHDSGYSEWEPGAFASPGLEQVAREGNPAILQMEAQSSPDVHSVVVGTGPYFTSQTIFVTGNPGDLFSVAWMLGRTNDLFSGLHDVSLPASGSLDLDTQAWDSGTEVNTGLIQDIPFYGNHNVGPNEHNPIAAISTYTIFNDPVYGVLTWNFPPTGHVTIQVLGTTPVATSSWGRVKQLYR